MFAHLFFSSAMVHCTLKAKITELKRKTGAKKKSKKKLKWLSIYGLFLPLTLENSLTLLCCTR